MLPVGNTRPGDAVSGGLEAAGVMQSPLAQQQEPQQRTRRLSRSHQAVRDQAVAYYSPQTDHPALPPSPIDARSNVSAMGAINSVSSPVAQGDKTLWQTNEYFGSSSTASLMRFLARDSMHSGPSPARAAHSQNDGGSSGAQDVWHASRFPVDSFLLPPRELADHLLDCFWDRVYCLYPFFDRPSFQDAYENLWISRNQPARTLSEVDIGLGSKANSGSRSIVFACALNIIFALGCHFADIPSTEREAVAHTFFLRSKQHIGLDMLDIRTIGVVQTLLIVALYLQSTPYPHRCWYSIGMACRIGLGLGLHEAQLYEDRSPLEQEFQRRTWHGCVMMDTCASSRPFIILLHRID